MEELSLFQIESQFKKIFQNSNLQEIGEESGFIIRHRTIIAERFIPSLIQSLMSKHVESLADLHRDFNHDHKLETFYKPYYEKLDTPCFPRMIKSIFELMLNHLCVEVLKPLKDGPFSKFKDILIQDGSSFAVHSALAHLFPGRFTKISPAAVELHCTMSLYTDTLISVALTSDSESERHYLPDPKELQDKLIMGDRGYDGMPYLIKVRQEGGYFLNRIRKIHNPIVHKIYAEGERYRKLEGRNLRGVLKNLKKDKAYDLDGYRENKLGEKIFFRFVLLWNPVKKDWIRLITNLERDLFTAEEIMKVYRLRWQIELIFKELKSYSNLHKFQTTKGNIAEGLIWASLAAAFLKRYLTHGCQIVMGHAISTRRVAMCGHHIMPVLFKCIKNGCRNLALKLRDIFIFLCHNAKRSNLKRERKRGRLAFGLDLVGVIP
jgi:hypothetical protein